MALPSFFSLAVPETPKGSDAWSFSYPDVGATRGPAPQGWASDRQVRQVGHGPEDWERLRAAIRRFDMFDLGWTRLLHADAIRPGADVVFAARVFGVWTLNACRIVYVVDEDGPEQARFGFAYGTLGAHAVAGEERFLGTFDKASGEIHFEIYKFSRPRHPIVRAMGPVTWHLQLLFSRECLGRMARAVRGV